MHFDSWRPRFLEDLSDDDFFMKHFCKDRLQARIDAQHVLSAIAAPPGTSASSWAPTSAHPEAASSSSGSRLMAEGAEGDTDAASPRSEQLAPRSKRPRENEASDSEVEYEANVIWDLTSGTSPLPPDFVRHLERQDAAGLLDQGMRLMACHATHSPIVEAGLHHAPMVAPAALEYFCKIREVADQARLNAQCTLTYRMFVASLERLEEAQRCYSFPPEPPSAAAPRELAEAEPASSTGEPLPVDTSEAENLMPLTEDGMCPSVEEGGEPLLASPPMEECKPYCHERARFDSVVHAHTSAAPPADRPRSFKERIQQQRRAK